MAKQIRVLYFPWPPAPPELRMIDRSLRSMQELVGGDIEGHTLATGDTLICHGEGRYVYDNGIGPSPHLFPYSGLDLSGLDADPLPEGGAFVAIPADRFEEVMARQRKLGVIDVYGPCFVTGPEDGEGETLSISDRQAALLAKLWGFCNVVA